MLALQSRAAESQAKEAYFFEVVKKNDLGQAKALLESGVNPNARPPGNSLNQTPIEVAVSNNEIQMVELLLRFKADPLLEDDNKDTAFVYAADSPRMMTLFRERGMSINTRNSEGKTPLLRMLSYATKEKVAAVLDAGGDPGLADSKGNTPLMECAEYGNLEAFGLILARKVDVNAQNFKGETALMLAVDGASPDGGMRKNILSLLDAKADLEKRDWAGRTVLERSVVGNSPDVSLLLLKNGAKVNVRDSAGLTPLMLACSPQVASKLIELGASVKEIDNDGYTALHHAAGRAPFYPTSGDETYDELQIANGILHLFIKSGADVNARNSDGETPLHLAAKRGTSSTIQILLQSGADINVTEKGRVPLDLAVESGDADKVRTLLKSGANPKPHQGGDAGYAAALAGDSEMLKGLLARGAAQQKMEAGRLLLASLVGYQDNYNPSGRLECIRELMKGPIDVNVRDSTRMTPLIWAAAADMPDALELILKSGGDVSAKDDTGRDALSWAAATGARRAIQMLLARGLRADSTDDTKRTPAEWAKICGQDQILALLKPSTSR